MTALEQARYVFARQKYMDKQQRIDAAVALGEWGVFSARQIGAICGLDWWVAADRTAKPDRTGGRLNPEGLEDMAAAAAMRARGERDVELVKRVLDGGTSRRMMWRLTGIPESTLERWRRVAAEAEQEEREEQAA